MSAIRNKPGRAPPSGPREVHQVFVLRGGSDEQSAMMVQTLKLIHQHLPFFDEIGIKVNAVPIEPHRITSKIKAILSQRGITQFPALTTPSGVYLGHDQIKEVYQRNLANYEAFKRGSSPPGRGSRPPPRSAEDELAAFYEEGMGQGDEREDDAFGDEGGGGPTSMMGQYRESMTQREGGAKDGDRGDKGRGDDRRRDQNKAQPSRSEPIVPPSSRPDNVGEDMDMGDEHNPNDDLMEQAYWANQESSLE